MRFNENNGEKMQRRIVLLSNTNNNTAKNAFMMVISWNQRQTRTLIYCTVLSSLITILIIQSLHCWDIVESIRILPNDRTTSTRTSTTIQQQFVRHLVQKPYIGRSNTTTTTRTIAESFQVTIPTSPDEHLVTDLPLLDTSAFPTKHWAGHLPANDVAGDKYFFYWLFEPDFGTDSTIDPVTDASIPLIIWLNGGPACSSMDGLFLENGPFRIVLDKESNAYKVVPDEYSWHKIPAYTLYIDQPVGTGLSITSSHNYPRNDEEVNIDFYYFLQQFLKLHADKFVRAETKKSHRPIYFSGESYAGHYIPSFINYVLKRNKDLIPSDNNDEITISITGAAIGNGWTDPYYQYSAAEFGLGYGLIDMEQYAYLKVQEQSCQKQLNNGNYNVDICFDLIDNIVNTAHGRNAKYKLLGYDIRQSMIRAEDRQFPFGHKVLETYLGGWDLDNRYDTGTMSTELFHDVLKAIHATAMEQSGRQFTECTDPPYNALSGNDGKGVIDDVIDILQSKEVKLLFFNGVYDIVCNHIGNEQFLNSMFGWDDITGFKEAERYAWYSKAALGTGAVSGYMKEYSTLQFLKINNAGHMVPVDVPEVAFDMIKTFVSAANDFKTIKQGLQMTSDDPTKSCPTCPTCLSRDSEAGTGGSSSTEQNTTNRTASSGAMGAFVISYAWIVAGAALVMFVCVISARRGGSSSSRMYGRQRDHIPISTSGNGIEYEIELRPPVSPLYRDDDDKDTDTNGTNGLYS